MFSDKNKILKSVKGKSKLQVSRKKTFPPFYLKKRHFNNNLSGKAWNKNVKLSHLFYS